MNVIDLLRDIRDILAQKSGVGSYSQPTGRLGIELPLVMANPIIQDQSLVGAGPSFTPLANEDIHHYTQGEILIGCESKTPAALVSYAAEVQVAGINQGQLDLLAVGVVSGTTGPLRVLLPIGSTFQQIVVSGRQLVNGLPSILNANDASMAGARLMVATKIRVYR